jgi:hypothetical protein
MVRKVWFIVLVALIFGAPINAEALDKRPPWKVLDEALTYLHGVPEVAWVKFEDHKVLIGWQGLPKNFEKINQTAAKNAAHALHNEVTVYSLRAEQTSIKESEEESYLCKTTANPQEITESNCR